MQVLHARAFIGSGNDGFRCINCGSDVLPVTTGGYRNHCPFCLHSRHVDQAPGDRASTCGGLMVPVGLIHHPRKGFQLIHRCTTCGIERRNRIVATGLLPDDAEQVRSLSTRAIIG